MSYLGKVLVVTSVFPRWEGDATPPFVQNQCELMVRNGWDIVLIAPHAKGACFREVVNGVKIYRYPYALPLSLQKLCYDGGMLINFKTRPWTKFLVPFLYLSQLIALFILSLRIRPDVLHSHSLLPQGLSACWVGRLLSIPHITTSHGNDVFGLKQTGLMGRLKRYVVRNADKITVNSSATAGAVVQLGGEAKKIELIPAVANEIPVNDDLVREIRSEYPANKRVLFVGRIIEEKGVFDLLEAFVRIHKEMPALKCLFVGEGASRTRLESMSKEFSVDADIHFVGWRPRHEIPSWMAAADLLVVPSKELDGWKEAQGLVIVEAMLVGTPVVASCVGGITDMIKGDSTGYLFPAGDVNTLTLQLIKILVHDGFGYFVASNARQRAEADFSSRAVFKKTDRLYRQVVSG